MKALLIAVAIVGSLFLVEQAQACQIQQIIVNGQIQTYQVCCNGYGPCIVTRVG